MRRALLASCALLTACAPPPEPVPGALQKSVRTVSSVPPCDAVIPLEWPASWPVPTGGKAGREFKLFFYPMPVTTREKPWIGAPLGEATFEAGGAVTACRRQEGEPRALSSRRWPEAVSGLGVEEFEKRRARLYALTGTVAARYAAKAAPGPEAREYARLFQELSEPDLGPYYKALNADFWAWLVR